MAGLAARRRDESCPLLTGGGQSFGSSYTASGGQCPQTLRGSRGTPKVNAAPPPPPPPERRGVAMRAPAPRPCACAGRRLRLVQRRAPSKVGRDLAQETAAAARIHRSLGAHTALTAYSGLRHWAQPRFLDILCSAFAADARRHPRCASPAPIWVARKARASATRTGTDS